jgi:hypothetical protein
MSDRCAHRGPACPLDGARRRDVFLTNHNYSKCACRLRAPSSSYQAKSECLLPVSRRSSCSWELALSAHTRHLDTLFGNRGPAGIELSDER